MNFKKILCVGAVITCLAAPAYARTDSSVTEGVTDLSNWGIGMFPQPDLPPEQIEVNRWSELTKTKDADYEYEDLSIDQVEKHTNLIQINLKVFHKNGVYLEQKNQEYEGKLDHDRYSHSEIFYVFNVKDRTYAVTHTKDLSFGMVLLGETDTPIEQATFTPIEKGTPEEEAFLLAKRTVEQMNPVVW